MLNPVVEQSGALLAAAHEVSVEELMVKAAVLAAAASASATASSS